MSELGTSYSGPPKYLKQRDQPLEIPIDCIRKLADLIDTSMDERCDLPEIEDFVRKREIPFEEGVVEKMFHEAASGRGYVTDKQMAGPLTHQEIAAAVRGRHAWNNQTKTWEIKYRPYRDHWIVLLLAVNPKIFALQVPKLIPSKIKAQYELEEDFQKTQRTSKAQTARQTQKVYQSVTEIYKPSFERDANKFEAGIAPEQTVKFSQDFTK